MREIRLNEATTIKVTAAGLITLQNEERARSLALPRFARSFYANPSLVEVVQIAPNKWHIRLADSTTWEFDAEALTIAEAKEIVSEPTSPTAEPTAQPTQKRVPRWMQALAEILKNQGFSEEQARALVAQVAASASSRNGRQRGLIVDPNSVEGQLVLAARKLARQLKGIRSVRFTIVEGVEFGIEDYEPFLLIHGEKFNLR